MNAAARSCTRSYIGAIAAALGGAVLAGCVADGGYGGGTEYDGGATVGYGVDYYEPYGYEYGGCCARYRVGPPGRGRGDDHNHDYGHDHGGPGDHGHAGAPEHHDARPPQQHPYRAAPSSRSAPSIPTGPRGGGGGHPGGGRPR